MAELPEQRAHGHGHGVCEDWGLDGFVVSGFHDFRLDFHWANSPGRSR